MNNTLIVYYSLFQNTANLALEIAIQTGGDIRELIPFCTHGGGGFCQIENNIAKECEKSIVLPGIAVNGTASPEDVTNWLETIGYLK